MADRHLEPDTPELRARWGSFAWSKDNAKQAKAIVARCLVPLLALPLVAATAPSDKQAVQAVLDKLMAGEALPPEILDRQVGYPQFPDLDQAIARVPGCKVAELDTAPKGIHIVQWKCKGRKAKDMPSVMMLYAKNGQVTKITTGFLLMRPL